MRPFAAVASSPGFSRHLARAALGAALLAPAWGCGSSQEPPAQSAGTLAAGSNVPAAPNVDRSRCNASGKQVITADTNLDKKPDVWKFFAPTGQGTQVATCKQVDLNHDGKVDIVYYYDQTGQQVTLEEFDLDFDGRKDQVIYWVNGKKVRIEQDMNFDQQTDLWKYFEDDKLVRIERDADFNGRVDEWEYYENGRADRIGYDTSGSGRVDRWDRLPPEEGAAGAAPAPVPGGEAAPGAPAPTAPAPSAPPPAPAATKPTPAATKK
jgi:uncharacterized membrane protein